MIYHITTQANWKEALKKGSYQADSYASEGFIHCSGHDQVLRTANRYYSGRSGLLLLVIDAQKVIPEIRDENLEGGAENFPHIYGALNLDAVVKALVFEAKADGSFALPLDA